MAEIQVYEPATGDTETMTEFPGWTFDSTRNAYYYYSRVEDAWVFQDGKKIQTNIQQKTEQLIDVTELEVDNSSTKSEEQKPCFDSDEEDDPTTYPGEKYCFSASASNGTN
jgi:hypothetical protein